MPNWANLAILQHKTSHALGSPFNSISASITVSNFSVPFQTGIEIGKRMAVPTLAGLFGKDTIVRQMRKMCPQF